MPVSDQKCRIYTTGAKAVHLIPHPSLPLQYRSLPVGLLAIWSDSYREKKESKNHTERFLF